MHFMDQESAHTATATPSITPDVGISPPDVPAPPEPTVFCPHCDYNLSGLPEDRCPECGEAFDRRKLIAWMTAPDQPPLLSMRADEGMLKLLKFCLFRPSRLGRELAVNCNKGMMLTFEAATKMLASFIAIAAVAVISEGNGGIIAFVVGVSVASMAMLSEMLLAGLLRWWVTPTPPISRKSRYRLWRNVTRCFGVFLPITAGLVALGLVLAGMTSEATGLSGEWTGFAILTSVFGGLALSFFLWWHNLTRAILARSMPSLGRILVILAIPAVGVGAIFGGFTVMAFLAAIMNR